MKSLRNAAHKAEILTRLHEVQPASERRWRMMSAHQMICHLSGGYRLYMGEIVAAPVPAPAVAKAIVRTLALYMPLPWPRGKIKMLPQIDQQAGGGTPPGDFAADVRELCGMLERFTRLPQNFAWKQHPGLGAFSYSQWMRLGYLHADHHLRQFGA